MGPCGHNPIVVVLFNHINLKFSTMIDARVTFIDFITSTEWEKFH